VDAKMPDFLQEAQHDVVVSGAKAVVAKARVNRDQAEDNEQELKSQEMMDEQVRARQQDKARAKYEAAMAHMQALSDKLGAMATDYDKRAGYADVEEAKAADKEHKELMAAAVEFPFLGLQTSSALSSDASPASIAADPIAEALKHHEVEAIEEAVEQEHADIRKRAKKDPMAALESVMQRREQASTAEAHRTMEWTALQDGWDMNDLPEPDETEVELKAHRIEEGIEKQGTHLSQAQQDAILGATRVHEQNNIKIDVVKRRLKAMDKLVEEDDRQAKKERMVSEAEQLADEKDSMDWQVEAVEKEAQEALATQAHATELAGREGLVQEFEDDMP